MAAAIRLSVEERSSLVNRLLLSLEEEPLTGSEIDRMHARWAPELRRRIAEIESDQVQCISREEADARIPKIVGETS